MDRHTAYSEDSVRLKRRLRAELRRMRMRILGHAGLILLGGLGLALATATLAVDGWRWLGPGGAWFVWGVLLICTGWVLYFELFLPLRRVSKLRGFSRELERHGEFGNLLEAATQFTSPRKDDPLERGASPELVAEVLRRARREAEADALAPRIPLVGVVPHTLLALVVLMVWLGLGWFAPDRVERSFEALSDPLALRERPPTSGLYAMSGDLRVPVGGEAVLIVRDFVGGAESVVLEISFTGDYWQEEPTELLTARPSRSAFLERSGRIDPVEDPFRYRFRKGSLLSAKHEVSVRERPVLRSLSARLIPPASPGDAESERGVLGGTVSVLEGTVVVLRGTASTSLGGAWMRPEGGEVRQLLVDGPGFVDSLRIDEDLSFRIELLDEDGLRSEVMTVYRFLAITDDPPSVRITAPESDLALDRGLSVEIEGLAADDVALREVNLLYRTQQDTKWRSLPLVRDGELQSPGESIQDLQIDAGERELALGFRWDLGEVELFPGDALSYCLEAVDNNELVGGQRTRSGVQQLRLPTVAEVLETQREQQGEEREDLSGLLEEGEKLQEDLEKLRRELMKNPEPDWGKQQEIKEALKAQEALREAAQKAAERMQSRLDEFQDNNAGSLELLEKMEVVQELLDSLQDDSLREYMEALEEALEQLNPRELQQAMEDAVTSQEEANRRLDRTIELLRQLERERAMGDLVEEASEYLARQEELLAQLEKLSEEMEDAQGEEGEAGDEGETGDESESGEEGESGDEGETGDESESGEEGESGEDGESGDESESGDEGESGESEESPESGMSEDELARLQEQLAQQTEALEKQLQEALDRLKEQMESGEAEDPAAEEMQKALDEAMKQMQEQGQPSGPMADASDKMQEGEQQEASEEMQEALKRLVSLYKTLADGQQGMTQASAQHAVDKLQQTAYDLLRVSHEQEQVVRSLDGSVKNQRLRPVTRRQARLLRGTQGLSDELHELSKKNFMVGEGLLQGMRDLVSALETTVRQMEYSRPRRAHLEAETSMGMMNQIVIGLLTAAEQQGQGGGGESSSQQMQQMVGDQSRLNAMTEELRRKMQQGLSEAERRQLAEMRAMQEQLRRELAQFKQNLEDERKILGDLDRIGEDMEKVAEELQEGRLQADTRELQDRILSRMLDAQRSIRERDFAKRRESREGEDLFGEQEGSSIAEGRRDRQRELRRWLAPDQAPLEYQDEVRRYFRRIEDELEGKGDLP